VNGAVKMNGQVVEPAAVVGSFDWNHGADVLGPLPEIGKYADPNYGKLVLAIATLEQQLMDMGLFRDNDEQLVKDALSVFRFSDRESLALDRLKSKHHLKGTWFDLVVPKEQLNGSDISEFMNQAECVGVFMNGWTGDTPSMLRLATRVSALSGKPCLVLNTPGTGRSDYGPSNKDWEAAQENELIGLEQVNSYLFRFLEAVGIKEEVRTHLVGHSYTGAGWLYLSQEELDKVGSLTMLNPAVVQGEGIGNYHFLANLAALSNLLPRELNELKLLVTRAMIPWLTQSGDTTINRTHEASWEEATKGGTLPRGTKGVIGYLGERSDLNGSSIPTSDYPKDKMQAFLGKRDILVPYPNALRFLREVAGLSEDQVTTLEGGHHAFARPGKAGKADEEQIIAHIVKQMNKR
jgi:pimeloyl-ACP methyl ester carboxylesterase